MRLMNTSHLAKYYKLIGVYMGYRPVILLTNKDKEYLLSNEFKEMNSNQEFNNLLNIFAGHPWLFENCYDDLEDYTFDYLPNISDMKGILQLIMVGLLKDDIDYIHKTAKTLNNFIALKYHHYDYNFLNIIKAMMKYHIEHYNSPIIFKEIDLYAKLNKSINQ